VLLNLVSNSLKYTKEGHVKLSVSSSGDTLRFDVSDTGIGIKSEDVGSLFEAFKQFDQHKNRTVKGTGLGLPICMYLVKAMSGEISVASVYGEGSTFSVTIPKVLGDWSQVYSEDGDAVEFTAPDARVLIVDDNDINLEVASEMIRFYDIKSDTALSGREAIEKLGRKDYDAVFMDHMMPEMDGVETTKKIRAMGGKFADIPIISLSANAMAGMKELFTASGMNDFLPKPIERIKLQLMLMKWMPEKKIILRKY
jgi:CheY-like chemotaxis protein